MIIKKNGNASKTFHQTLYQGLGADGDVFIRCCCGFSLRDSGNTKVPRTSNGTLSGTAQRPFGTPTTATRAGRETNNVAVDVLPCQPYGWFRQIV